MIFDVHPGMYLKKSTTYNTVYTRVDGYCEGHYDGQHKDDFCARWGDKDVDITEITVRKDNAPKSCYLYAVHRDWAYVYQLCDSQAIQKDEWDRIVEQMTRLLS